MLTVYLEDLWMDKLLRNRQELMDSFVEDVEKEAEILEYAIFTSLVVMFQRMATSGRFVNDIYESMTTLTSLSQIAMTVDAELSRSTYLTKLQEIPTHFNSLDKYNRTLHYRLNDVLIDPEPVKPIADFYINELNDKLLNKGFKAEVKDAIKTLAMKAISKESFVDTFIKQLKTFLVSNSDNSGVIKSLSSRLVREVVNGYNGAVNLLVRQTYQLDGMAYISKSGGILQGSRPQCVRWSELRVIPIKDLEDEIEFAKANGKGMKDSTTVASFEIDRGGYNCRHQAIPIRMTPEIIAKLPNEY